MALFDSTCPDCDGPLERRDFEDGVSDEGSMADVNRDWWCPACRLRWMNFYGEPMEAEA